MARKSSNIIIDLGKGVQMSAPFKKHWTLAEWRRMTSYVEECIGKVKPKDEIDDYR